MPGVMSEEGDLLLTSLRPRTAPCSPGAGRQSLLAAMNKFVAAVDEMDGAVMIPCRLQDMQLAPGSEQDSALVPVPDGGKSAPKDGPRVNLYTYYGMLRAIRSELVRGSRPEDKNAMDDDTERAGEDGDDLAKQTATMFRHHLCGLFDVLRQMTSTADLLTERYQTEIGDSTMSSSRNLTHFTL